ncbi:MAG: hydroxymethylbilane synthase [Nitrososphaeria archaeon]
MTRVIRIATRPSQLAVIQAELVGKRIRELGYVTEVIKITTEGDEGIYDLSLKSAFTRRLELALRDGKADIAVHSLKDLPSNRDVELGIAFPLAGDPADCLVSLKHVDLFTLESGKRVGTSSLRRKALINLYRPDLEVVDLRGNVDTRLKKLGSGQFDALVLSCEALRRLGVSGYAVSRLDPNYFPPAPGQGIIAVEYLDEDERAKEIVNTISDRMISIRALIELAFNEMMQGGCHFPAGIYTIIRSLDEILIKGYYSDGRRHAFSTVKTSAKSYREDLELLTRLLKNE